MNRILIRHNHCHHILPRDNWRPPQVDLHLLDVPMRIGLFPHRIDLIPVVPQGELHSRGTVRGALNLCTEVAVVTTTKVLGYAVTLWGKDYRGGFPRVGGEKGMVRIVIVED